MSLPSVVRITYDQWVNSGWTDVLVAAAVAHAVPGAVVTLGHADGVSTTVSYDPTADLDPCGLRSLLSREIWGGTGYGARVRSVSIGGSVEACGGGVFACAAGADRYWCFVTTLGPSAARALAAARYHPFPTDDVILRLVGDMALGVTVGIFRCDHPASTYKLEPMARDTRAACAVEELISEASGAGSHPSWDHSPDHP
jgi:hypothetical protein